MKEKKREYKSHLTTWMSHEFLMIGGDGQGKTSLIAPFFEFVNQELLRQVVVLQKRLNRNLVEMG